MKKTLSLFLCILLLLLAGCSSGEIRWAEIPISVRDAETDRPASGEVMAMAFALDVPLGGLSMQFEPTGEDSEITVELYKAKENYEETLKSTPKRKETFKNPAENMIWQFRTLPAGSYLLVFSDAKNVNVLKSVVPSQQANGRTVHYKDGTVVTDGLFTITLMCIQAEEERTYELLPFSYPTPEE